MSLALYPAAVPPSVHQYPMYLLFQITTDMSGGCAQYRVHPNKGTERLASSTTFGFTCLVGFVLLAVGFSLVVVALAFRGSGAISNPCFAMITLPVC